MAATITQLTDMTGPAADVTEPATDVADPAAAERASRRRWMQMLGAAAAGMAAAACQPATASRTTNTAAPRPTRVPRPPTAGAPAAPAGTPPATAPPTTRPPTTAPPTTAPPVVVPTGWADPAGLHAARRLTWGATPALAEEIRAGGLAAWVDRQIAWQSLDDSAIAPMVAPWPRPGWTAAQVRADQEWLVPQEMAAHETIRRVFSPRQLHEVMVDFWHDHFSVDVNHIPARFHMPTYDRTVIRPHALGRFRDLLPAVAASGAMLHFLNQVSSRADGGRVPNENYARELMELHTVGSGAGYSQDDVIAVAHLLTGWSTTGSNQWDREIGTFTFRSTWHNPGPMTSDLNVLGWSRGSLSGEAAGRAFLDHLARHPLTARRLCHKLAVRLIGEHIGRDDAVVTAAANAFTAADTSIAAAVRSLVLSSEFASSTGAKIRRPGDLVTQMARALGLRWVAPNPDSFLWNNWSYVDRMGHANHAWPTPDGYPDDNAHWLSVGALVSRWNLAVWFAYSSVPGLPFTARDTQAWAPNRRWGEWLDAIAKVVVGEPWVPEVRASVLAEYSVNENTVFRSWDHWAAAPVIAVLLQSAAFQRR